MNVSGVSAHSCEGPGFLDVLRECLVCGIVFVDPGGRVVSFSPEAARILGWPSETPSGPRQELPSALNSLALQSLSSGRPVSLAAVPAVIPNRGEVTLRLETLPVRHPGASDGVVLAFAELKASPQFDHQVQQLDRLANAGTLAAGMAHDVKNALVAGNTFIDLLLQEERGTELALIVRRELDRIEDIVSRMLKFSGPTRAAFGHIHLHALLEHCLRIVQHKLKEKSISLQTSFLAANDLAEGHEYELEQVFVNVLLNAVEAMASGGVLTIRTQRRDPVPSDGLRETAARPQLSISVQDTGAGILPEHMSRLFQPFFTTKPAGTGLGLAITHRILEAHGGSIEVNSRAGEGTTLTIFLPLLANPAPYST